MTEINSELTLSIFESVASNYVLQLNKSVLDDFRGKIL